MMMMVLIIDDCDDNDGHCYDDGKFYNAIYAPCNIFNTMSESFH